VNVVVRDVAGNHQANRRDMETGRVVSVAMADFHDDQVVPGKNVRIVPGVPVASARLFEPFPDMRKASTFCIRFEAVLVDF